MPPATNRPSVLPYLYLVIAAATWGGTWVLVRGVREEFPQIAIAFWRNHAVPRVGAHIAGLFGNLVTVFGIGFAVAFLGEIPQAYHGVGMALICLGLYLISRGK